MEKTKKKSSLFGKLFSKEREGWLYVLPCLAVFVATLAYPIAYAIRMSFFDIALDFSQKFVGLNNYLEAFSDKQFWNALKNTLIYTVSCVSLTQLIGLLIATALSQPWLKGKKIFHLIILIPWTISYVVIATMWKWILNSSYGVINAILLHFGIIEKNISFLGNPKYAMITVILVNVWRSIPFSTIMLYAALQQISTDQIEASKVDGANAFQTYWYVTLPTIRGVISVTTILNTIWTFIQFDLTSVMTKGGGPNHKTELLSNLVYNTSFIKYDFGYGSAISVLMLIVVLVLSIFYKKMLNKDEI